MTVLLQIDLNLNLEGPVVCSLLVPFLCSSRTHDLYFELLLRPFSFSTSSPFFAAGGRCGCMWSGLWRCYAWNDCNHLRSPLICPQFLHANDWQSFIQFVLADTECEVPQRNESDASNTNGHGKQLY